MRTITLVLMSLLTVSQAAAQYDYGFDFTKAGTAGYQFLKIGAGARETALGQAAAALTNDANAVFWNVGGLPLVEQPQVLFSHASWLNGSAHDAAVLAIPVGPYVFGISAVRLAIDEFEETTVLAPTGTGRMVGARDLLIGVAASRRFTDKLTIGVQLKYVEEKLDDVAFHNFLFDVGAVYYTGFHFLRLAFALQHFGADMNVLRVKFRMPLLFRLSVGDDLIKNDIHRLTAAAELVHPTDNDEVLNTGVEYEFMSILALRGGYRVNADEGNLTFGAGVRSPSLGSINVRFDYAYVTYGEVFGATHRFSLGVGF